ncbi:MAG: PIN domain nuclease [Myxococcota bacterium]|nr:PIN domain nuclease [Myxococcota bacterium]
MGPTGPRRGLTLDAGALIALERRRARVLQLLRAAAMRKMPVTVPVAIIAEWWRGRTDAREAILATMLVEPMDAQLARAAGEALAVVPRATTIDAIVTASAARRGDVILTSDPEDLSRLADHFGSVRILAI